MPAKPIQLTDYLTKAIAESEKNSALDDFIDVFDVFGGLTKLEYAAIQIFSCACVDSEFGDDSPVKFAVNRAHALFDELEKQEK